MLAVRITKYLFVLAALSSPLLRAQAPGQPAPPAANAPARQSSVPVIRTTSRLVQINVVVQNKKGVPIDGLTKDNFVLTDQGKPQDISVFSIQTDADPQPADASSQPLPAGTFANRLAPGGRTPGTATIILFDALNSSPQDQNYAREQMIKFLEQLRPQDHVALYVLTTRLMILHEFTYDSRSLIRAVGALRGPSGPGVGDAPANPSAPGVQSGDTTSVPGAESDLESVAGDGRNTQRMESFLNGSLGMAGDFATINRVQTTAAALAAIAQHVRAVPGRKNLIWLSGSFPISIGFSGTSLAPMDREQRDFSGEIEAATRALNDVNLAVYPIDIRGLINPSVMSADSSIPYNSRRGPPVVPMDDPLPVDTMKIFAERTGGRAYYNANDLSKAARDVLVDSQLTYQLGFYPNHGKWDGKFHELKIRLVKVPDATIRYRSGYFAVPEPPPTPELARAALEGAIDSPVEFTGLSLQVRPGPPDPSSGGMPAVDVTLDPRDLQLVESGGKRSGAIDVLFAQLGASGNRLGAEAPHLNLDFDAADWERVLASGLILRRHISVLPGAQTLRVIVRDANSGAMGSLSVPLSSVSGVAR